MVKIGTQFNHTSKQEMRSTFEATHKSSSPKSKKLLATVSTSLMTKCTTIYFNKKWQNQSKESARRRKILIRERMRNMMRKNLSIKVISLRSRWTRKLSRRRMLIKMFSPPRSFRTTQRFKNGGGQVWAPKDQIIKWASIEKLRLMTMSVWILTKVISTFSRIGKMQGYNQLIPGLDLAVVGKKALGLEVVDRWALGLGVAAWAKNKFLTIWSSNSRCISKCNSSCNNKSWLCNSNKQTQMVRFKWILGVATNRHRISKCRQW